MFGKNRFTSELTFRFSFTYRTNQLQLNFHMFCHEMISLAVHSLIKSALCVLRKQLSQLQSDKRYLEKSNKHLENILEATHACKKHEVSELNRIHVETIKVGVCRDFAETKCYVFILIE